MTTPLPGFTNIVHLTEFNGIPAVRRQGRPIAKLLGIDRQREAAILRQIQHLDIGPELLDADAESDQTTFRAIPGTPLDTLSIDRTTLAETLRVLSVLHAQPALGTPFSSASMIRDYLRISAVPAAFEVTCLRHTQIAEQLEREPQRRLCHNDCVAKNWILQPGAAVRLVDYEFAGPNDPAFDLATWCLTFHIDPADSLLADYPHWNPQLAEKVRAYLPVVDTLWALFCGILARHLAGQDHHAAISQMQHRVARL